MTDREDLVEEFVKGLGATSYTLWQIKQAFLAGYHKAEIEDCDKGSDCPCYIIGLGEETT